MSWSKKIPTETGYYWISFGWGGFEMVKFYQARFKNPAAYYQIGHEPQCEIHGDELWWQCPITVPTPPPQEVVE